MTSARNKLYIKDILHLGLAWLYAQSLGVRHKLVSFGKLSLSAQNTLHDKGRGPVSLLPMCCKTMRASLNQRSIHALAHIQA